MVEGRDGRGRFAEGNPGGPGRPPGNSREARMEAARKLLEEALRLLGDDPPYVSPFTNLSPEKKAWIQAKLNENIRRDRLACAAREAAAAAENGQAPPSAPAETPADGEANDGAGGTDK
jgi:hypothetical protein